MVSKARCPNCQMGFKSAQQMDGKRARCARCGHRFVVTFSEPAPVPDEATLPAAIAVPDRRQWVVEAEVRLRAGLRSLGEVPTLHLAALWLLLGLTCALADPWFLLLPGFVVVLVHLAVALAVGACGVVLARSWSTHWLSFLGALPGVLVLCLHPVGVQVIPVILTLTIIVRGLFEAVGVVGRTGRPLDALPQTAAIVAMFSLLFFQIAVHLGAGHFHWVGKPAPADWLVFPLVHAFRAGDLLDVTQAYGISLQRIHHRGWLTSALLVTYHLVLNFFLIGVLLKTMKREVAYYFQLYWGKAVLGFLAVLLGVAIWQGWRVWDLVVWPIDSLLRVIDFTDAMELYQVRLHNVPPDLLTGSLALVFRLLVTMALLERLDHVSQGVSLRWLRGVGLSKEELESVAEGHPDPVMQARAQERLENLRAARVEGGLPRAWRRPTRSMALALGAAVVGLFLALLCFPPWTRAAAIYAERAAGDDDTEAEHSCVQLRRLGPWAGPTSERLEQSLSAQSPARRRQTLFTLAHLGEPGGEALDRIGSEREERLAQLVVEALEEAGPDTAHHLAWLTYAGALAIHKQAGAVLRRWGVRAVEALLRGLNRDNSVWRLPWIVELDAYWEKRTSSGRPVAEFFPPAPSVENYSDLLATLSGSQWDMNPNTKLRKRWEALGKLGYRPETASLARQLIVDSLDSSGFEWQKAVPTLASSPHLLGLTVLVRGRLLTLFDSGLKVFTQLPGAAGVEGIVFGSGYSGPCERGDHLTLLKNRAPIAVEYLLKARMNNLENSTRISNCLERVDPDSSVLREIAANAADPGIKRQAAAVLQEIERQRQP